MKIVIKKQNKNTVGATALIILFLLSCMKWLIEGLLDKAVLEVLIMIAILLLYFWYKGTRIKRNQVVWLLFALNIFFSILMHKSTIGIWGKGAVTILTCCFIIIIDVNPTDIKNVIKTMAIIGVVAAIFVFIHYLFKDQLKVIYISRLNETARNTANLYLRHGYYFGLLYNPHEPAGLIAFSIIGLLAWSSINHAKRMLTYIMCVPLLISLLMTGKKAVFLCSLLAYMISMLFFMGTRKQCIRGLLFICLVILAFIGFAFIVVTNPDIVFLKRFNTLFVGILNGDLLDSSRVYLYQCAINEWKKNILFGIGWRQFNALTVSEFRMAQGHEVNNDYLQWLCETGIFGFILSAIPVIVTLYRTGIVSRKILRYIKDTDTKWAVLLAIYIQLFTVIYAFVEIPFFDFVLFTMYAISCIIINNIYSRRSDFIEQGR